MAKAKPAQPVQSAPTGPTSPTAPPSITWNSVRLELNNSRTDSGIIDYDKVRRAKLAALEAHTRRPAVLYATDFLNDAKMKLAANAASITLDDVRGLAE